MEVFTITSRLWALPLLILLSNDVELNPGPSGMAVRSVTSPRQKHKSNGNSSNLTGVGAFIPREALDPRPSREERQRMLEAKQEALEAKFNTLVDELSKYRDAAVELAAKNTLIEELKDRVATLEAVLTKKGANGVSIGESDLKIITEGRKLASNVDHRLVKVEEEVDQIKLDLGELMYVYDDVQDRMYDIDRTWKNNLVFHGIKLDSNNVHESPDCLDNKIRQVLKNKLNIGREIVIMRCQRVFNGLDKFGNRPIVVNFQKWSDKEEILRKSKILKNSGISVEEDLSRAAKTRRVKLEKLVKEIKAVDPDRKCFFKYDKLIIDDEVFVYNDIEQRVERLPFNLSGNATNGNDIDLSAIQDEFTASAVVNGRGRSNAGLRPSVSKSARQWRTKSVESIIGKIPDVSNASLGVGSAGVSRMMSASTSTPSIVASAKEKARVSAQEKMTPNFDLDRSSDACSTADDEPESAQIAKPPSSSSQSVKNPEPHANSRQSNGNHRTSPLPPNPEPTAAKKSHQPPPRTVSNVGNARLRDNADVVVKESSEDEYLPLNNVVDWDEWNTTGCYVPPAKKSSKTKEKPSEAPKLKSVDKKTKKQGGRSARPKANTAVAK